MVRSEVSTMNQEPEPLLPANARARQLAGLIEQLQGIVQRLLTLEQDLGAKLTHLDQRLDTLRRKQRGRAKPEKEKPPMPDKPPPATQILPGGNRIVPVNTDTLLPEDAITATKASQLLRVHVCVIHRWVNKGRLPGWRVGAGPHKRLWVSLEDVMNMVKPAEPSSGAQRPHSQTAARLRREFTERTLAKIGLTVDGKQIPKTKD